MFRYLAPAEWPPPRSGMLAGSILVWPQQRDAVDALTDDVLVAGNRPYRGLGLIGLADDEGIRLNGGRPGAKAGPDAFRAALARYGVGSSAPLSSQNKLPVVDAGNLVPGRELQETHERVAESVAELLSLGLLPVGIGGGHDLTWPLVRAVAESSGGPLHGIYFDAHLDVREEVGSGMPFRRLMEAGYVESLRCIGLDHFANSTEHLKWFLQHGGSLEEFAPEHWPQHGRQFVSLDLDVLDAAYAPGVSAMNPAGLTPPLLAAYAEAAGRSPSVCCFDIMELSPPHDRDARTARLAAHLFLRFVQGCAARQGDVATQAGSEP